jgi:hypothetical protein
MGSKSFMAAPLRAVKYLIELARFNIRRRYPGRKPIPHHQVLMSISPTPRVFKCNVRVKKRFRNAGNRKNESAGYPPTSMADFMPFTRTSWSLSMTVRASIIKESPFILVMIGGSPFLSFSSSSLTDI